MRRTVVAALAALAALALTIAVACAFTPPAAAAQTVERAIDPAKSTAQFGVQHIFVERVTGTVPIVSGAVTLPEGSAIPTAVTAVLDPARIASGDRDRDASLESPDYFDVKVFPTWTFVSTKIAPSGASAFGMDGTLTIHGVARPEHLDVVVRGDAAHPSYHATGHLDRHAFGMKGARLDPVIGNVVDLTLDVTLK